MKQVQPVFTNVAVASKSPSTRIYLRYIYLRRVACGSLDTAASLTACVILLNM